jgi:uncharacterized protein (DUF58 family)
MTLFGLAALAAAIAALATGLSLDWVAFDLVGLGLLAAVLVGLGVVARRSPLVIDREIQPPRVPKGSPAIAFLTFANRGRRTVPVSVATQPFGPHRVRTVIPKLRGGERGTRAYRLPTTRRGVFDVDPVELTRRDAFEFFRISRKYARTERIWVYPRILPLRRLPTGQLRHLEGPSSDIAPQGNITFHRLRDYVAGDDLRLVHWRSTARAGRLVVKHNVDTSQPYTVVLLDLRPSLYTEQSFEDAVDVAASVLVASASDKAPVELRLTDGSVVGGPRAREVTALIDHLTAITPRSDGSLQAQLIALRRLRGGTSLVVITGELSTDDLPYVANLRRRFDQLVVVSVDPESPPTPDFPGVRIIVGPDADAVATAWNHRMHAK